MTRTLPVLTVLLGIIVIWYAAAVWMNATWVFDQAERSGTPVTWAEVIPQTMAQDRPLLPPPHQVGAELWKGLFGQAITSKRSLVYHAYVTFKGTMMGFGLGIVTGVLLAMAMAGLGLTTHVSAIRQAGMKPLALAALLFAWLIGGGLAINAGIGALLA